MEKLITTNSAEETMKFAETMGRLLKGGEVIELISDVGGGKTTFVRGLAKGAGSNDHVSSPTFTLSKKYSAGEFDILHFDFYRLNHPGVVRFEIEEAMSDPNNVVIVEWSDIVKDVLPAQRITIDIKNVGEKKRLIQLHITDEHACLMKDNNN